MDNAEPRDETDQPLPPHAPTPRQLPEEPLVVVDRLLADEASQLVDEQNWDLYAQLEDELAVEQGSLTLIGRLAAAQGQEICLELPAADSVSPVTAVGVLDVMGIGWLRLQTGLAELVVNVDAIASVVTSTTSPFARSAEEPSPSATWTSMLRGSADSGRQVVVHRRTGPPVAGRIVLAGRDHFDVAVVSSATQMLRRTWTVPLTNLVCIELR